ncbi:MAG TPA: GNAT family N-acetyltransferase [Steroidobacteraceae bacterium]|nr:GNAT family N-acetyltransferase [Steroidobacteraceae bacterium]
MNLRIKVDDLSDPHIAEFLGDHLKDMYATSPPESVHALDIEGLKKPEITFWTAWDGATLVGTGAIKRLDAEHAELKSMRTAPSYRRSGVAATMLLFIMNEARRRGYKRMSLETGSMAYFEPARALYARHGFEYCGPFADYWDDPNSKFMTRSLIEDKRRAS